MGVEKVEAGVPGAAGHRRLSYPLKRDYIWRRLRRADDTRQWTSDKGVGNILEKAGPPRRMDGVAADCSGVQLLVNCCGK